MQNNKISSKWFGLVEIVSFLAFERDAHIRSNNVHLESLFDCNRSGVDAKNTKNNFNGFAAALCCGENNVERFES